MLATSFPTAYDDAIGRAPPGRLPIKTDAPDYLASIPRSKLVASASYVGRLVVCSKFVFHIDCEMILTLCYLSVIVKFRT